MSRGTPRLACPCSFLGLGAAPISVRELLLALRPARILSRYEFLRVSCPWRDAVALPSRRRASTATRRTRRRGSAVPGSSVRDRCERSSDDQDRTGPSRHPRGGTKEDPIRSNP